MSKIPISDRGCMANSIAQYVLDHPDTKDIMEAYNDWVRQEQHRDFPWGDADVVVLCLELFHTFIHAIPQEVLADICYDEACQLIQT